MNYAPFLKPGDTLALIAPSGGIRDKTMPKFNNATKKLGKLGFSFTYVETIFNTYQFVSAPPKQRAQEFLQAYQNPNVNGLFAVAGGEFMVENLPFWKNALPQNTPAKWFTGFSDNTALCYYLATYLDTASLYHYIFPYFGMKKWHPSLFDSLNLLTGKQTVFHSNEKFQVKKNKRPLGGFACTEPIAWKINNHNSETLNVTGRLFGGCLDILEAIAGTEFDKTKDFTSKYNQDGIIWFFETCDLTNPGTIRALWRLKHCGWFTGVHTKAIVFGRPAINEDVNGFTFESAALHALEGMPCPIVFGADVGHVPPTMPFVNGAVATIKIANQKATISYEFV